MVPSRIRINRSYRFGGLSHGGKGRAEVGVKPRGVTDRHGLEASNRLMVQPFYGQTVDLVRIILMIPEKSTSRPSAVTNSA
jgi:hypothetical protein